MTVLHVLNEGDSNRGSREIASCVLKFKESKTTNVNEDVEFIFYSDNCHSYLPFICTLWINTQ